MGGYMERLQENIIKTSVRNLVEFILRSGDIDNRHGGSEKEAMQAGKMCIRDRLLHVWL